MDNMRIYNAVKMCPKNALREIKAGKLKGKSDINPVWRIKVLTEQFGPCGIGWKFDNVKYWTEPGAHGEVSAWCSGTLKIKENGEWSDGIESVGGSMLVNTEKGSLVTNDEAYKMAYTDAVSVGCKMLGVAADVYWEADRTKYSVSTDRTLPCSRCNQAIQPARKRDGSLWSVENIATYSTKMFGAVLCPACMKAAKKEQENAG